MSSYERGSVGWWIDERRGELGMTLEKLAAESGLSIETLYRASNGRAMRPTTRGQVERALRWKPSSINRILRGEEPVNDEAPASVERRQTDVLLDQIEQLRQEVLRMRAQEDEQPPEQRRRSV